MKEKYDNEQISFDNNNFFQFLEELNNEYRIIKCINKSNISKIYQAENIFEKRKVYLKVIEKSKLSKYCKEFMEQIKREEKILKLCKSQYIINLYEKIETKNYIIFELEFCGKDLSTYIKEEGPLKKILNYLKMY